MEDILSGQLWRDKGGKWVVDEKKFMKIFLYILLAGMFIFTVLFFFDIKFVVMGLNVIAWDMLAGVIWIFVKIHKWAGRENTTIRRSVVIAITLVGLFASVIMFVGLSIYGGIPSYVQQTEPQTKRTFAAEYQQNMMMRGSVKLYERFGPLLFACDVEKYVGEFSLERPEDRHIYISKDEKSIVVAYFFLEPTFIVPLD